MEYKHQPVMLEEIIEFLRPKEGQTFIDCTLGGAGYALRLASEVGSTGKVVGIDLDPLAIENAKQKIAEQDKQNIILVHNNFKNIAEIAREYLPQRKIDGIVLDLGLSSAQLDDSQRGFSFQKKSPLDMGFDISQRKSKTYNIVNTWPEEQLYDIIRQFGEERYAKSIARQIVKDRKEEPIDTTQKLVNTISHAVPSHYKHGSQIHFATRTFQALRIATNDELENLRQTLPQAVSLLREGARVAVVSFHSLEDRIVKRYFKKESKDCLCPPEIPVCRCGHKARLIPVTKKPARATAKEIENNPRARSAKLRVAEKI